MKDRLNDNVNVNKIKSKQYHWKLMPNTEFKGILKYNKSINLQCPCDVLSLTKPNLYEIELFKCIYAQIR